MIYKARNNYDRHGFSQSVFPFTQPEYGYQEDHGKMVLKKIGEKNVYKRTQEAADDVCLQNIIARLTKGDTSAVGDVVGGFVDVTTMPKTLQEAQNLAIFAENYFKGLPSEVKNKYQNNLNNFLQAVDSLRFVRAEDQKATPLATENIIEEVKD